MVALERTIQIQAFHYIPADAIDLEGSTDSFVQRDRLYREVPALGIYDVTVEEEEVADLFEDEEGTPILTVIQRHFVAGERSNIVHKLRPEDWLVQDHGVEGGWRVLTPAELHKFLKG
jgi:hypothetical protein